MDGAENDTEQTELRRRKAEELHVGEMFCELCFDYDLLTSPHALPAITGAHTIGDTSIELIINRTAYILRHEYTFFSSNDFIGGYIELTCSGQTLFALQTEHSHEDSGECWNKPKSVDEFVEGPWIEDFLEVYRQAQEEASRQEKESKLQRGLDENDVVAAVCGHLQAAGYHILQRCRTTERGIDIIAERPSQPGRLLIEAKGGTAARAGSRRFGKAFNRQQVLNRVAKGFYTAGCLCSSNRTGGDRVGLALPDTEWFRDYLNRVKVVLDALGITVFLVKEDRSVVLL
jgi:hypothetical protein